MNAYQKAILLVSFTLLPLVLLFINAMNYRGVGVVGIAWIACTATLLYVLRPENIRAPRLDTLRHEPNLRLHSNWLRRGFGSRGRR